MVFKKTTFLQFAFKNKRPINITRATRYDDRNPHNNDKVKTFCGPDTDRGQAERQLTIELRYKTNEELVVIIQNCLDEVDDDGFTVSIKDGNILTTYTGCYPSDYNPSHSAEGKPVLSIELDVTERTVEYV